MTAALELRITGRYRMNDWNEMKTASIEDIEMQFLDEGTGSPLVLLHGFTGAARDWERVFDLRALAREYRVIVPDLRGHGRTNNPSRTFTHRQCARDVALLMGHLGVDRFDAVGLSLGGNTLLHIATTEPERVTRMVLVAATTHYPDSARAIMRTMAGADRSDAEWALMRARHQLGDDAIRALWRHMAEFAVDHEDMAFDATHLGQIQARTLIVNGDRDPLYGIDPSLALYRSIDRSSLWIIPDGGHGPIFEAWRATFAEHALAFLRTPL